MSFLELVVRTGISAVFARRWAAEIAPGLTPPVDSADGARGAAVGIGSVVNGTETMTEGTGPELEALGEALEAPVVGMGA
jgi:hypothetical protein